ncbi:molecular chaperone [Serratia marcescens]|uniref:Molecular chaperone n=1 Tax=Serratia marcescens TaxID=615 RepID=A0A1Q4P120_SERMA|nr:fimbria/pilus periplasmic chaperone [Serratia marcescens]OKB66835.1 molecular chaperone [Serratia marcescens]
MKRKESLLAVAVIASGMLIAQQSHAAIALDRTRVIFDGAGKSMSLSIRNENTTLPYLAQGWIEDSAGKKIESPLMVLPPLQRVEAGAGSQVKIQATPAAAKLPQDRESLFYFNLREIPPRSNQPNTLQIALQTRIKLFYRPKALIQSGEAMEKLWREKLTLTRRGDVYWVNNPTPYFITFASASASRGGKEIADFKPVMVAPKNSAELGSRSVQLGDTPVLRYINDYGGRPALMFRCQSGHCRVTDSQAG